MAQGSTVREEDNGQDKEFDREHAAFEFMIQELKARVEGLEEAAAKHKANLATMQNQINAFNQQIATMARGMHGTGSTTPEDKT